MKKFFVALFALVTFFSTGAFAADSQKLPLPDAIKDSLPWFAVRELKDDNTPFTRGHLARLTQNHDRVALVYFATWCIPCRAGIKQIVAHQAEIEKSGTAVVLVNVGERETNKVKEFLTKLSADKLTSVSDPYGRLTEGFGLVKEGQNISLPRTIVVDKSLKVLQLIGEEGGDYIELLKGK